MGVDVTERQQAEEKSQGQQEELQRWCRVTVGREERLHQLKREVDELLHRLGEPARYGSPASSTKQHQPAGHPHDFLRIQHKH